MALVHPHPALRASVPINAMVDGWRGDDWFHNGAFRQDSLTYVHDQEATRGSDIEWWTDHYDDYDTWMAAGSAAEMARLHGLEQVGFAAKLMNHPAYDAFWQDQALDKILAKQGLSVPTMLVPACWCRSAGAGLLVPVFLVLLGLRLRMLRLRLRRRRFAGRRSGRSRTARGLRVHRRRLARTGPRRMCRV
jgi:hypothetical protein